MNWKVSLVSQLEFQSLGALEKHLLNCVPAWSSPISPADAGRFGVAGPLPGTPGNSPHCHHLPTLRGARHRGKPHRQRSCRTLSSLFRRPLRTPGAEREWRFRAAPARPAHHRWGGRPRYPPLPHRTPEALPDLRAMRKELTLPPREPRITFSAGLPHPKPTARYAP